MRNDTIQRVTLANKLTTFTTDDLARDEVTFCLETLRAFDVLSLLLLHLLCIDRASYRQGDGMDMVGSKRHRGVLVGP